MNIQDSASVLGLTGKISPASVKLAYKKACSKYHPDRNPAGTEMMKVVNAAYVVLKNFSGDIDEAEEGYGDALNAALNSVVGLQGVKVEVCGVWVWVTGDTKKHKDALGKNGAGFHYASKKKAWYYRPADWSSKSRGNWSLEKIRSEYGSKVETSRFQKKLKSA